MKKLCKLFLLPYLLTLETYAAISKLMTWLVADKPYDQGNVKVISNIHSADQCSDTYCICILGLTKLNASCGIVPILINLYFQQIKQNLFL